MAILEGLQEHGLLASIWCLSRLSERAQNSLYFSESLNLFYDHESHDKRNPSAELDLIVVVDGVTYLCDIKSSSREFQREKFTNIAEKIRPHVAIYAVMDMASDHVKREFNVAKEYLEKLGIGAELLEFDEEDISRSTILPSGDNM